MIHIQAAVLLFLASLPGTASHLGWGYPRMYPMHPNPMYPVYPAPMYPMNPMYPGPMYPMPQRPMYPLFPTPKPSNTTIDPLTGALTGAVIGGLGGLLLGGK